MRNKMFVGSLLLACVSSSQAFDLGGVSDILNSASGALNPKARETVNSSSRVLKSVDRAIQQQQYEDMKKRAAEQREQKRAAYRAAREERAAEAKRRWDAMTPAQRQAAINAKNKQNEIMGQALLGIMFGGGGGGDTNEDQRQREGRMKQEQEMPQSIQRRTEESNRMNPQGTGAYGSAW